MIMSLFFNLKLISLTILLWISLLVQLVPSDGANILFFFPAGTFSHKQSIWPLVTALADKGHNVTFFSAYGKRPYDHPKVHDLKSASLEKLMMSFFGKSDKIKERQEGKEGQLFVTYHRATIDVCQYILNSSNNNIQEDPDLYHVTHEAQYDLIVNNVVLGDCGLILAHQKKAKLIMSFSTPWFSPFHDELGFPAETAWIPDMTSPYTFPMGLLDRIYNYFLPISWYLARQWELYPALEGIMKEAYGLKDEEVPSLNEVVKNASLAFSLSHFSMDFARSLPPMVVNVGGMQCWIPTKKLEGEFKDILDKATNGAVLIAFGSTINLATMPQYFKDMFFNMMTNFPEITFIWRWDGPLPPNPPKNLIVSKWLPQFQILSHPNLKGFISHAGLNSLTEATFNGVPIILLPLFADQDYNGYRVEAAEVGIKLEVRELSTGILVHAVKEILTNPKYSKNMKATSALMKDRPMNPIETAVYWTEFVLRHEDTSSLKPLQNQSWFVRRQLDIFVFFVIISTIVLTIAFASLLYLSGKLFAINCKSNKDGKLKSKTN